VNKAFSTGGIRECDSLSRLSRTGRVWEPLPVNHVEKQHARVAYSERHASFEMSLYVTEKY
jgi:hypothetical protein